MSRGIIATIAIIVLIVIMGGCSYNGLVQQDESVNTAWSKVQSDYQRRADLIPNLVNTVKGAAEFEKSTLTDVVNARANATSVKFTADQLTPENIQRFQQAQSQLNGSLSRLLAVAENYPQLKANENFRDLQAQLEGTENRIKVSRNDFNDAVQSYNRKVRSFPTNVLAGMFGFSAKAYFEADAGAEKAPTVKF
ncbi:MULTISPECIES: LemA family protein [unclassified Siphonobacter]|uniref:LemA family protein n=1 Tax=unclassified Siphonobacter TaxID=2635712 RepID=UPI000CB8EE50|nr:MULTISPECIES: LemA family protein [unclassified Siphonobacter]MDQ1087821.1 LemA protein [Siphonobacter sp. SORGH_AS_1065]MDR6193966.1 LemA protein [Siphonobacter sp. SORGH_AS_0500]PKK35195.1 LemA family protein [Siphonobacter sp. SORGH_AS_0500]